MASVGRGLINFFESGKTKKNVKGVGKKKGVKGVGK